MAARRRCLWKQFFCPQTKACGQGPQENKQARRKQQASLSPLPSLPAALFSQPLPGHLSPSGWPPLGLLLHVVALSLTLVLCFPSPDPALPIIKMSHICPLFPMPIVPPRASFLSSLSSLPVLDVDNIDNIARATFLKCKFDYITPLLKTLQGLPVAC